MANLLIVESPTKARTIGKMLGGNFNIAASMGHIMDLPEHDFGVDVGKGFLPLYVENPKSRQVIKKLKSIAKDANGIYLASDPDREGEAIAWHLKNVLSKVSKAPFYRVTFHEITRNAIENALRNTTDIDKNLVDAQQARRVLDRLVGYKVSPLLWRKLENGRSAGRVQSAALRLVVEREREILAFVPEEYWIFTALFARDNKEKFSAKLIKIDGKDVENIKGGDAEALVAAVKAGSTPLVALVNVADKKHNPPPPFTTSTLQQSANTALHFSATSTMRYAQQLYEGIDLGDGSSVGLITYMRTDSVTLSRESQIAAAKFIEEKYGPEYRPEKFNYYKNKAAAQEAHEAIRPTDVRRTPESVAPYLDAPQLKLYTLIWKRFVASQMTPSRLKQYSADVNITGSDNREYRFRAVSTVTVFPGYQVCFNDAGKQENEAAAAAILGAIKNGEKVKLEKLDSTQKMTEPPPRYSEAALIKALEENGIGRPSTYATILRTIQDRNYVKKEQQKLVPAEIGFAVNDFLVQRLPELFDIGFTAKMESELDDIESGKLQYAAMMQEFYDKLMPWIQTASDFDAPPAEEAQLLIKLLSQIDLTKDGSGNKISGGKYDSARFFNSVKSKFDKTGKISVRQQQALISLCARFIKSFSPEQLQLLPAKLREEIAQAADSFNSRSKTDNVESAGIDYKQLFAAFNDVNFTPPETRGKITYDDRKFFNSLKKQALAGNRLSEKQIAALRNLAKKYRVAISGDTEMAKLTPQPAAVSPVPNAAPQVDDKKASTPATEDLSGIFAALSRVEFALPVKRGKYTYDDKKFFTSLKKQFDGGRELSDKQIAALQKMASKYGV